jgi:hypothetical protein
MRSKPRSKISIPKNDDDVASKMQNQPQKRYTGGSLVGSPLLIPTRAKLLARSPLHPKSNKGPCGPLLFGGPEAIV